MRRRPDERWIAVKAAVTQPQHPIEAACWNHLHVGVTSDDMDRAIEIFEEPFERERLQPWLLAGVEDGDLSNRTGLTDGTIKAYRHLFFNVTVFRDLFEKQLWVQKYNGTDEGALFLQKAVLHGVEAVAHVMGAESRLDPAMVVESTMRDLFYRGQAVRYGRLSSPETMAAHALLKSAVEQSQLLTKTRPATITDIMLKLKNRDMTRQADDVELEGEILH